MLTLYLSHWTKDISTFTNRTNYRIGLPIVGCLLGLSIRFEWWQEILWWAGSPDPVPPVESSDCRRRRTLACTAPRTSLTDRPASRRARGPSFPRSSTSAHESGCRPVAASRTAWRRGRSLSDHECRLHRERLKRSAEDHRIYKSGLNDTFPNICIYG